MPMPALLVQSVPFAKARSKQPLIKPPAHADGSCFRREPNPSQCYRMPVNLESPMKLSAALTIALCLFLAAGCRAEDDVAKARKELQAAVDAAVKQHPELDDVKAFVASRIKGSNGWDELVNLAEQWREISESADWTYFFRGVTNPKPSSYSEEELVLLRVVLQEAEPVADAAKRLMVHDCFVGGALSALDNESIERATKTLGLVFSLRSRAIAMAALKRDAADVSAAVLLALQLAARTEYGIGATGAMLAGSVRAAAVTTALSVAEDLNLGKEFLQQIVTALSNRPFTPRDHCVGEVGLIVEHARKLLAMTEAELLQEARKVHDENAASGAGMLRRFALVIQRMGKVFQAMPADKDVADPRHAEPAAKALEALPKDETGDALRHMGSSLFMYELSERVQLLAVRIRLHEATAGAFPDADAMAKLLAEFPGVAVERKDDRIKIKAADGHPAGRLSEETSLARERTLEPRTQEQEK